MYKLFVLEKNTWNNITVQIIIVRIVTWNYNCLKRIISELRLYICVETNYY